MKKRLVTVLCSLLAAFFLMPSFSVFAKAPEPPEVTCTAAVLYNLETEEALFEKNMDSRLNPAAFTKLMTALLAFEYRQEHGNVTVTVTEEMLSSAGGTSMKLKAGEIIAFDSLLSGLVVQNANDAALVLASVVGGNISSFVEMMNEKAKQMGMEHTYYANPTGTDSAVMHTTLKDTLLLAKAIYKVNDFMVLSEMESVTIPKTNLTEERKYTNKNALVPYSYVTDYYMEDVRGLVAGYTQGAGYCVGAIRQKGNCTNLVLISGGIDRSEKQNGTDISSYREAKALLEWGENSFSIQNVIFPGTIICEKGVRLGAGVDHMILVTGEELRALLPSDIDLKEEIQYEIHTEHDTFTAPIIEKKQYGTLDLVYEGRVLGTVSLVAQSGIGLSRWLVVWDAITGFFSQGPARVILILSIAAVVIYILVLIGMVWLQYIRTNREKAMIIAEINQQENLRMQKVRREERDASRARRRLVRGALREGFRVLSGEAEVMDPKKKKSPAHSKAVAKVPEKYRRSTPSGQPSLQKRPGSAPTPRTGHYQVSRPGSAKSTTRNQAPSSPERYRTGRKPNGPSQKQKK